MRKHWLACVLLFTYVAAAQNSSLSGTVRDERGAPIAGAQVTLAGSDKFATTSDSHGAYHFSSLPPGAYHLQASLSDFATRQSEISLSSASPQMTMDLTLTRQASQTASRPQFEAAGVRGLIDPGGYSASTNAAAASGLIEGIADIKRTGNDSATSPTVSAPCALEPALKKAFEEKPESGEANLRLGEFYLAHGQAGKAVPILERARSLNPGNAEAVEQLAKAYIKTGRFDAALQLLTPLTRTAESHRLLARANEGAGKFVEASREYQSAANLQPDEENLFGMGYELILAGLPKDAERAFQTGATRYPQSIQLLIGLGSAQFLEGRALESIQTLLRAVDLNPVDPRPYPFLAEASGVSSDDAGRVHGAMEHYLSIAPNDPRASYYFALNLLHEPGANDAHSESLLKHAILLDPNFADAHFQLGVLYGRRGDYQSAAHELETAIRLSPGLKEAHYRLAIVYREIGHRDLAATEMQRFRELQGSSATQKASIDQFISVFDGAGSVANSERLCPGDSPEH